MRTLSLLLAAATLLACGSPKAEEERPPRTTASPASAVDSTAPAVDSPAPAVASPASAPAAAFPAVTFAGFGAVRFGMTAAQAQAATGGRLKLPASLEECGYARPIDAPKAYGFMMENGRVVRVDVRSDSIRTAEGAGIGDAEARVQQLYPGRVRIQPHKYTDGHYLMVTSPADSTLELVFETDGRVVTTYRAGLRPAVEYVEGCS